MASTPRLVTRGSKSNLLDHHPVWEFPNSHRRADQTRLSGDRGFQNERPNDQQVADERETLLRDFENNSKLNSYILNELSGRYANGEDRRFLVNSGLLQEDRQSDDSRSSQDLPEYQSLC
jgi:hypothetical protein